MDGKTEAMGFEKFAAACEVERLQQFDHVLEECEEFTRCVKKMEELYEKIKSALPQDMVVNLMKYSDACVWQRTLTRTFFYRSGLKDGALLSRMLAPSSEFIRLDINVV